MREALKSDAVSRIQVLQAESDVAETTAAVSNAEAALNTARTNLAPYLLLYWRLSSWLRVW